MHTEHVPFTPESQAYSARAWGAKDATWGLQPHLKPNHKQDFKTFLFSSGLIVPAAPELPPVVEWFWVCWRHVSVAWNCDTVTPLGPSGSREQQQRR